MDKKDILRIQILGSGTSSATPRADGYWGACNPNTPKNNRRRASLLVQRIKRNNAKTSFIIDTGTDLRMQLLDAKLECLDAVLYTHAHADHIHGIDDLRIFSFKKRDRNESLYIYGHKATITYLYQTFRYCFFSPDEDLYPSILKAKEIRGNDTFVVSGAGGDLKITPILQTHGKIYSLGFRIENVAYCVDLNNFSNNSCSHLNNLDLLIIETLQMAQHRSHLSLKDSLGWIEKLMPKRAILTALGSSLDYNQLKEKLSPNIIPAYDGLTVEFPIHDINESVTQRSNN